MHSQYDYPHALIRVNNICWPRNTPQNQDVRYWSIIYHTNLSCTHTCKKEQSDLCNISVVSSSFCRCLLLLRCFSWDKDLCNHIYVSSRLSIYLYIYTLTTVDSFVSLLVLCLWRRLIVWDEALAIKSQRYVHMNPSEVSHQLIYLLLFDHCWLVCVWFFRWSIGDEV